MNDDDKRSFEEMFLKDAAVRMMRNNVKYDPTMKAMHETIMNYGLSETQALMLIIDITEITRKKDE